MKLFRTRTWNTARLAARVGRFQACGLGDNSGTARTHRLIFSPPLRFQDAKAVDVCVASSNAEADREDTAHAAFAKQTTRFVGEVQEIRQQDKSYRPAVWTADGRPHPAVIKTLRRAADIPACRNGQQMSPAALKHLWKHDVQTALVRRCAAMTRALPPSLHQRASGGSPADSSTDPSTRHWAPAPPLDGCDDDKTQRQKPHYPMTMTRLSLIKKPRSEISTTFEHTHAAPVRSPPALFAHRS